MRGQEIVSPGRLIEKEILLNYRLHSCDVTFENLAVENLAVNRNNISKLMNLVWLHKYVA